MEGSLPRLTVEPSPAEGLPTAPAAAQLTADEIARLASIAVQRLGVRQIRFTGGEPLLRRDLTDILYSGALQAG